MLNSTAQQTQTLELTAPVKLNDQHILDQFDSGDASIDDYLRRMARKAQAARHTAVYVMCFKGTLVVAGYYTLSSGSTERSNVVPKSRQRNSPSDYPVTLLGRLGVTLAAQGNGFGADLLHDAVERAITASESVGSSAIVVHPLNERLASFYSKHAGFIPCPQLSPITLMLSMF